MIKHHVWWWASTAIVTWVKEIDAWTPSLGIIKLVIATSFIRALSCIDIIKILRLIWFLLPARRSLPLIILHALRRWATKVIA
jgi:hypothetical protein